jgi:CDP-paratose 2-epimerase
VRKKNLLVTGSGGLVGSEIVTLLHNDFDHVYGVDNNQRKFLFGKNGDVNLRIKEIINKVHNYSHCNIDIRARKKVFQLIEKIKPTVVVHCAAQPSHDLAAKIPFQDFDINTVGTFNLIETTRLFSKNPTFIFLSTKAFLSFSLRILGRSSLQSPF